MLITIGDRPTLATVQPTNPQQIAHSLKWLWAILVLMEIIMLDTQSLQQLQGIYTSLLSMYNDCVTELIETMNNQSRQIEKTFIRSRKAKERYTKRINKPNKS